MVGGGSPDRGVREALWVGKTVHNGRGHSMESPATPIHKEQGKERETSKEAEKGLSLRREEALGSVVKSQEEAFQKGGSVNRAGCLKKLKIRAAESSSNQGLCDFFARAIL